MVFTVTLSKTSGVDQEFSYGISIEADDTATPEDFTDFMGGSGTMTIAAGETSAMVSVMTADDDAVESSETFTLTVGAALTAKGTITDNDSPSVSVADASAEEGMPVVFDGDAVGGGRCGCDNEGLRDRGLARRHAKASRLHGGQWDADYCCG